MVNGAMIAAFRVDIDAKTPELLTEAGIYIPGECNWKLDVEYTTAERSDDDQSQA
jgi:hypothetical protein